jgi:hypothetical protein
VDSNREPDIQKFFKNFFAPEQITKTKNFQLLNVEQRQFVFLCVGIWHRLLIFQVSEARTANPLFRNVFNLFPRCLVRQESEGVRNNRKDEFLNRRGRYYVDLRCIYILNIIPSIGDIVEIVWVVKSERTI